MPAAGPPSGSQIHHSVLLWLIITFGLTATTTQPGRAMKVSVSIPELVKLNDPFWLNCTHSMLTSEQDTSQTKASDDIYSIKWYKDDEEFYRYLPKAEPKVSTYETNGIQLDQIKSHDGNVYISKADVNSEGNYRCEILSEAPSFETVRKSKVLKVYALPVRGPRIEILDANGRPKSPKAQEISYAVGDKIELRCNSAPSKPPARLRWYLNEQEIVIPTNSTGQESAHNQSLQRRNLLPGMLDPSQGYDVRITPVEYRLHYKSIYSSHSTLSLVLQQNDLINNKISFKCLASMRQDVALQSKQLIVLPPAITAQMSPSSLDLAELEQATDSSNRFRRDHSDSIRVVRSESDAHVQHYQRPQQYRHTMSRLSPQPAQARSHPFESSLSAEHKSANLQADNPTDTNSQMLYIYEESDSTLGPSILDRPDVVQAYIGIRSNGDVNSSFGTLEFNKADNLEYIQLLRERTSKSRSLNQLTNGALGLHGLKRGHGVNSLVKSPLYLDELDPMRPLINWPPLSAGRLILPAAGQNIVAIPTRNERFYSSLPTERRFVLPSKSSSNSLIDASGLANSGSSVDVSSTGKHILLEKLVQNLNCTCTEGSLDIKLSWTINEATVHHRDTRHYPVRISPDHRQTWSVIGFAHTALKKLGIPMLSKLTSANIIPNAGPKPSSTIASNEASQQPFSAIRFACQATHSVLLYSSSEMITFDFNPPPISADGAGSNERLASSASNVIQATSASQSSSASHLLASPKISHLQIMISLLSLTFYLLSQSSKNKPVLKL